MKPKQDFVKLILKTEHGDVETEFHNLAIAKEATMKRAEDIAENIDDLGLNIAFVMLDSISAATFRRVMPKSLAFLSNQKDTIFFKGKY